MRCGYVVVLLLSRATRFVAYETNVSNGPAAEMAECKLMLLAC